MKKNYFICFLLVFFSINAIAQTPQYFKGAGTGSNSYPFSSTAGLKTQHLYVPGDLPGAVSGNITRIYFRSVTPNVSGTFTNFSFKLGQTTASQFPGSGLTFATPLTTVISGSPYTVFSATGTTDWFYVDLPTPFPFNASQSLILEVVWDAITAGGFNVRTSTGPAAPNNKRLTSSSPTATTGSASTNWMDFGIDVSGASACPAPTGLAAAGITYNSANLSWTAAAGATGYEYAVTTSSTPPATGTAQTATTYPATGLTAGTTYYLHVRTNCGTGFSTWTTYSFTTMACSAPTGLASAGITYTGANLSWATVAGALGYQYAVTTSATPPASGTSQTPNNYSPTGLTSGTTYYLHVRTECAAGIYSAWSTISFATLACSAPAGLATSNITTTTATVNWTPSGAGSYEYGITSSSTPPASGSTTTNTTINLTGLAVSTNYCLHVRTVCAVGIVSAWSTICFNTAAPPPCPAPTGLVATNTTATTTDISWGAITGASGYEFDVSTNATPPLSGTAITNNTTNVGGLIGNTAYYLHVRTDCGSSNFSSWVTSNFNTADTCLAPTATVSNITDTTADINWSAMTGALSYEYDVSTNATPPANGTNITMTTYNATNLAKNTQHYVHLRTICINDTSSWSTSNFTTTNVTSVAYISGSNIGLEIYPNPATDFITVKLIGTLNENAVMSITDIAGRTIKQIPLKNNKTLIDMSTCAKGLYFLKYSDNDHALVSRIVKE